MSFLPQFDIKYFEFKGNQYCCVENSQCLSKLKVWGEGEGGGGRGRGGGYNKKS